MKKSLMLIAAAMLAVSASAQKTAITGNKFGDNWYVGLNVGAATPTQDYAWMKNLSPSLGLRVGKNLTTVFGVAAEINAYKRGNALKSGVVGFDGNDIAYRTKTWVGATNVNVLGLFNLSNLFAGYQGEPRVFEVIGIYGLGWGHHYGLNVTTDDVQGNPIEKKARLNSITSKVAVDFAFNLGADKAWQIYLEPSLNYGLQQWGKLKGANNAVTEGHFKYNLGKSNVELRLGVNYKFLTSNGTHNFAKVALRDQAEIDALNAQINELRNRKPEVVEKVVEKIVEKDSGVREVKVENLVFVTFAQGKSTLTADAKKALNEVASGKHVQIVGTASPEGSKALNDRLSQARADVVANYLKERGVVIDEATGKGVQGTTSNRLAIVYVK